MSATVIPRPPGHEGGPGEGSPGTSPLGAVLVKNMKYIGDTSKKTGTVHPKLMCLNIYNHTAVARPVPHPGPIHIVQSTVVIRAMESIRPGESMEKELGGVEDGAGVDANCVEVVRGVWADVDGARLRGPPIQPQKTARAIVVARLAFFITDIQRATAGVVSSRSSSKFNLP
ncbi:hypothetical protein B0H66DRAFT_372304 [Apodospora peruviana]|uniref:Uncharacterized protein n=1 Tax=Apodospora peruviana TaxID=516989 RepID=A0AAE0HY48_9PEZI|nr:hypothetical protein B0H66DRAFT_372304 [Apodospora peruviana]